jgi:biopolymer transport protein ExbB
MRRNGDTAAGGCSFSATSWAARVFTLEPIIRRIMHLKRVLTIVGLTVAGLVAGALPAQASVVGYFADIKRWFGDGGNTMWFILACSIVAVAFTLERLIRMRKSRIVPRGLADQARALWREGRHGEILALCDANDSVLARAIRRLALHRRVPMADVRSIVGDSISAEISLYYRRIHPISVAAMVAPLLGLFGTVSGMITAFRQFRALGETGDPGVFAGAISVALITTQAGLMVAVPALAISHYFRNRTNTYVDELDGIVQELLLEWYLPESEADAATGPSTAAANAPATR